MGLLQVWRRQRLPHLGRGQSQGVLPQQHLAALRADQEGAINKPEVDNTKETVAAWRWANYMGWRTPVKNDHGFYITGPDDGTAENCYTTWNCHKTHTT